MCGKVCISLNVSVCLPVMLGSQSGHSFMPQAGALPDSEGMVVHVGVSLHPPGIGPRSSGGLSPAVLVIEETRCLECPQSHRESTVMSLKNIPVRDINKDSKPKAKVLESHP